MIVTKNVLSVHPAWCLLFLIAYVFSFYVFSKTDGNVMLAVLSFSAWVAGSATIIYWYYGIPFTG